MTRYRALNQDKAGGFTIILSDNLSYGGAGSPDAAGKVQLHPWFQVAFDHFPKGQKFTFSTRSWL